MPFVSDSQRRWMFSQEPEIAKRWAKHTPKGKKLPEKKEKSVDKKAFVAGMSKFFKEAGTIGSVVGGLAGLRAAPRMSPKEDSTSSMVGQGAAAGLRAGAGSMLGHILEEALASGGSELLKSTLGRIGIGGAIGGVAGYGLSKMMQKKEAPKEEPKKAGFEYGIEVFCKQNGVDKAVLAKMAGVEDVSAYLQSVVNS